MYLDWSEEEDELRDESDYEETVLVDWLQAVAIKTSQSPLFTNGKMKSVYFYQSIIQF